MTKGRIAIMSEKDNPNVNRELSTEENANMIDGIINNLPPVPVPQDKPLDRVIPPPGKNRSRGRER